MQYMGSKQRIADWILHEIADTFPETNTLVDLMSGSGSIANAAASRGWGVWANDIQPYSHRVLEAAFEASRAGLPDLIEWITAGGVKKSLLDGARASFSNQLATEQRFADDYLRGALDWRKYAEFCSTRSIDHLAATGDFDLFSSYYANTYFGVRQCLEIDALEERAAQISTDSGRILIAALISSLTFVASTTTHLAQYLKPTSQRTAESLIVRRTTSVEREVLKRLQNLSSYRRPPFSRTMNLGFQEALTILDTDPETSVIYADPPYFKEHYSRYYHVLDTVALYDYPDLTYNNRLRQVTVGRYREGRIVSDFGLRSRVEEAFRTMFASAIDKGYKMALSYADTSLLNADQITHIAESVGYSVDVKSIDLRHSGQGKAKAKSDVIEYLFLLNNE